MHIQKHECSSCGYPSAKTRKCTFPRSLPGPTSRLSPPVKSSMGVFRQNDMSCKKSNMRKHGQFANRQKKNRQLGREGQAKKDCWHRPLPLPQGRLSPIQERLPNRHSQGRSRPYHQVGVNQNNLSTIAPIKQHMEQFFHDLTKPTWKL